MKKIILLIILILLIDTVSATTTTQLLFFDDFDRTDLGFGATVQKYVGNPLVDLSPTPGSYDNWSVRESVLLVGGNGLPIIDGDGNYTMYYRAENGTNAADYTYQKRIAMATGKTTNLLNWTKKGIVLDWNSTPGMWDSMGVGDPYGYQYNLTSPIYLFYVGANKTGEDSTGIGIAIWNSSTQVFDRKGLILDTMLGSYNEYKFWDPVVVYNGTAWRMWYSEYTSTMDVYYVESYNADPSVKSAWSYPIVVYTVAQEGVGAEVAPHNYFEYKNLSYLSVQRFGSWGNGISLGFISAPIGTNTWSKYSGNPVVSPTAGQWDARQTHFPFMWINSSNFMNIFYSGNSVDESDANSHSIGLATWDWSNYPGNWTITAGTTSNVFIYNNTLEFITNNEGCGVNTVNTTLGDGVYEFDIYYPPGADWNQIRMSLRTDQTNTHEVDFDIDQQKIVAISSTYTSLVDGTDHAWSPTTNTWNHFRIVHQNGTLQVSENNTMYINTTFSAAETATQFSFYTYNNNVPKYVDNFSVTIVTIIPEPLVISIVNNSKTNDTAISKIFLNNSESITFFAGANQEITAWNWYVDNVLQSNNYNNLTTSWSTGKYHYVSLNGSNTSGTSNTLTWGINVYPAMATATIGALNETPADEIREALENKDAPALVMATVLPFTNLNPGGTFFYAIIWFTVFVMMWIKQKSMNIPMVIGIVFGGLIISFLPEQYQLVATALIVLGIFAVIYIFFKGRG